jgi:hypothetical protein
VPAPSQHHRLGALALSVAGVLFLLYPVTRPWTDESTVDGARTAMASGWWVASHLFAMVGFILATLGLLAVYGAVGRTPAGRWALAAVVTAWIGAGLTLPYYGAEDFGLHAIARAATDTPGVDLLALVEATRFSPVAVITFGVGLIALAVGAVLAAVAVWRSALLPRAAGVAFGAGFALFLPQFLGPPAVRIAHGALMLVGCGWLAVALWRVPADR